MSHFEQVTQFNEAARGDLPRTPTVLTLDQTKLALRLLLEESFESFEACFNLDSNVLMRLTQHKDAMQWLLKTETTEADLQQDSVALLDGLCDTVVVAMGMATMAGLPFDEGMNEVNASNLAKIDKTTGKCIKDEGGKIQKPKGWVKPDLEAIVEWGGRFGNRGDVQYQRPVAVSAALLERLDNCGEFPGNLSGLSKPAPL